MEYGDWTDWFLCLGIAVLLGARLPMRNPEGHSPRWWKRHPEAVSHPSVKVELRKTEQHVPQGDAQPLHESTLLWSAISLFFSVVLAVVATITKDLRWLLAMAWPWGVLAIWKLFSRIPSKRKKWSLTFSGWTLIAVALFLFGFIYLRPQRTAGDDLAERLKRLTEHTHIAFWEPDYSPVSGDPRLEPLTFSYHVSDRLVAINIGVDNAGDFSVLPNATLGVALIMLPTNQTSQYYEKELLNDHPSRPCHEILPYQRRMDIYDSCWMTINYGRPLNGDDVRDLTLTRKTLCVVGKTIWRDGSGRYETDIYKCQVGGKWRGHPGVDARETRLGD